MALKDDLIKQLNTLAEQLGHPISTAGTTEDLKLRLRESQDELAALNDGGGEGTDGEGDDNTGGDGSTLQDDSLPKPPLSEHEDNLVKVRALKTLHIKGIDPKTKRPIRLVLQGAEVLVDTDELPLLKGLVEEV